MPNWCFSNVEIIGTEDDIDRLEKEFGEALSRDRIKTDFGPSWMGNLLLHIGMSKDEVISGDTRCRGTVTAFEGDMKHRIVLDTETAWVPMMQCIDKFVRHYTDDAAIFYCAEEPGCDVFWSNDEEYIGHVYIDYYPDTDFPADLEKAIDAVQYGPKEAVQEMLEKYLGHTGTFEALANELDDRVRDINEDLFVSCHVYDNVPLAECT